MRPADRLAAICLGLAFAWLALSLTGIVAAGEHLIIIRSRCFNGDLMCTPDSDVLSASTNQAAV